MLWWSIYLCSIKLYSWSLSPWFWLYAPELIPPWPPPGLGNRQTSTIGPSIALEEMHINRISQLYSICRTVNRQRYCLNLLRRPRKIVEACDGKISFLVDVTRLAKSMPKIADDGPPSWEWKVRFQKQEVGYLLILIISVQLRWVIEANSMIAYRVARSTVLNSAGQGRWSFNEIFSARQPFLVNYLLKCGFEFLVLVKAIDENRALCYYRDNNRVSSCV